MADVQMSGTPYGHGGRGEDSQSGHAAQSGEVTAAQFTVPISRFANAAGAVVSLALLVGVGVWGYKLLIRDVSGIPVVRAAEGPMRVPPANPGGRQADHQGLAVNEVAGLGTASGPVDQVALAPRAIDLVDEDVPVETLASNGFVPLTDDAGENVAAPLAGIAVSDPDAAAPALTTGTEDRDEAKARIPVAPPFMTNRLESGAATVPITDAAIQALADQIAADVKPLGQMDLVTSAPVRTSLAGDVAPAAMIDAPGVRRSLRPRNRPGGLRRTASAAPAQAASATPATGSDVDPATIATGTRLVQLGAFESAEIAREQWVRISARFDSFFDGKQRVIQKAQSGGRTFYRLRALGFADVAESRRFCAALVAEKADCIPVVTR